MPPVAKREGPVHRSEAEMNGRAELCSAWRKPHMKIGYYKKKARLDIEPGSFIVSSRIKSGMTCRLLASLDSSLRSSEAGDRHAEWRA